MATPLIPTSKVKQDKMFVVMLVRLGTCSNPQIHNLLFRGLGLAQEGTSALIPVIARPMISFWIWEVPSYKVVTRTSRK